MSRRRSRRSSSRRSSRCHSLQSPTRSGRCSPSSAGWDRSSCSPGSPGAAMPTATRRTRHATSTTATGTGPTRRRDPLQASSTTSPSGTAQHSSALPAGGGCNGSGSCRTEPAITLVQQPWHAPTRQPAAAGTAAAVATAARTTMTECRRRRSARSLSRVAPSAPCTNMCSQSIRMETQISAHPRDPRAASRQSGSPASIRVSTLVDWELVFVSGWR